jgi:hypothetical protein
MRADPRLELLRGLQTCQRRVARSAEIVELIAPIAHTYV